MRKIYDSKYRLSSKGKEQRRKYHLSPSFAYGQYKRNAKYRDINFQITLEEFISFDKQNCFYCGDKLKKIGLDRIDNTIGYIIDNIVPCCKFCNIAKHKNTVAFFINKCYKITNRHPNYFM